MVFEVLHELLQALGIVGGCGNLATNLFQPAVEVVHAEVEHQMLGALAQRLHIVSRLLALGKRYLVHRHLGGEATDVDVIVIDEVSLGNESRVGTMGHRLAENLVVEVVAERQSIDTQVDLDELCDAEVVGVAVFGGHILEHHLFTMTDDVLDDHLLYGRGSALLRLWLGDDGLLRSLLRHRAHFLLSLALADELIHLTDERSLGDAHALRAVM